MKYLSLDIEATGLKESDLIIEFAMVPVCSNTKTVNNEIGYHSYIKCPSFEELKPNLDEWVIENNESLINKAHSHGIYLSDFKNELVKYFERPEISTYFNLSEQKITILGKSLNAIDLPFLNRDLGWNFMRKYFNHQVLDVSSVVMSMIDKKTLPSECRSGSYLSKFLSLGEVDHTALADAVQTAEIYFKLIELKNFS